MVMPCTYLVIEEILFVLERFGAADILQQKMCKRCGNDIAVFRCQLDFWLRSIVNDKHRAVAIRRRWRQKYKLRNANKKMVNVSF